MPASAELQAWIQMFAGEYTSDLRSGSPQEFIGFSTTLRNDPEFLRFYQGLEARAAGEPVKLEIKDLAPDSAAGALSFGGKSYRLKFRGVTAQRASGLMEYGKGTINFAAEGNAEKLKLWFWSSNFAEAPAYPDVVSINFNRDKPNPQSEQVFAEGGFTFRYPSGWTIQKEKSRIVIQPDRWFGDSLLQLICFETHGSGQEAVTPVLDALVQLMTAGKGKDQTPKSVGKIRPAQAFGKAGSLITFEQKRFNEHGQWFETRIRTFVIFHEEAAVVLWAEGPPDGMKKRDGVLLKLFSTFSGHKPSIANYRTQKRNLLSARETKVASRDEIIQAVTNYVSVNANTNRDLFVHIGDHPELLTEEAMEIFEMLVRQAKLERGENHPGVEDLVDRRDLLLKARELKPQPNA